MLSVKKYSALCVLGAEIFYVLCLFYGYLLSAKGKELHEALFQLIPGYMWGDVLSMVWGALFVGALAWIAGCYIAWMHNASRVSGEARGERLAA